MKPCPVCGGQWLRGLTYQHRTSCRIYAADTPTIHHDYEHRAGIRLARDHEGELAHDQNYPAPESGQHYGIRYQHAGGFHHRTVVLLDDHGRLIRPLEQPFPGDTPTP